MNGNFPSVEEQTARDIDPKAMMAELVGRKARFVGLLTLIFMTGYIGLTVLAGFARPFLAAKAIGPVNVGFVLIAANYLMSWGLALIYIRVANSTFDPMVARVSAVLAGRSRAP